MHTRNLLRPALSLCAALLVTGTLFAGTALADPLVVTGRAPAEEARTATVRFGDLDLASPAGRQRLEWRVRGAVRAVCPDEGRGVAADRHEAECRHTAWAGVRPQMAAAIAGTGTAYAGRRSIRIVGG